MFSLYQKWISLSLSLIISRLQLFLTLMNGFQEHQVDNLQSFQIKDPSRHEPPTSPPTKSRWIDLEDIPQDPIPLYLRYPLSLSPPLHEPTSLEHHSPSPQSPTLTSHGPSVIVIEYISYSIQSSCFSGHLNSKPYLSFSILWKNTW